MTFSLWIHPEAALEFYESIHWYESRQTGLGSRFEFAVVDMLERLSRNPHGVGFIDGKYCQARVFGFPFVIVYTVSAVKSVVYVSAIFHTSRNPDLKLRKED